MATKIDKLAKATIVRNRLECIVEQIVAGDAQEVVHQYLRACSDIWELESALMEEEKTAAVDVQAPQTSENLFVRDHDTGIIYDMGDITEKDRKVPGCIFTHAPWNVQITSRKPTATPSSEDTPGGAAEKMPGGGSGNFDREGGLDFSDLYPIRNPEYESGALTGNIDNFMPWHVAVDDTTFHAEITIPVKVFFCQNVSDVADEDPDISVGVAYEASGGHLYVAATYESGEFLSALDDVLVKAEKLQALTEYQTAYEHWKTRAKAYRRGVVDARRAA